MERATPAVTRAAIEATVREHWGYILAILAGRLRDLELAEDVLQDAAVAALRDWPAHGVPENPRAWLLTVARRRSIDLLRRDARFAARRDELERLAVRRDGDDSGGPVIDERLSLMFMCCHPALPEPARVALTLRTLGGLTTSEIARAFLQPEATMAQRLVRAKAKIKAAGIPYRVPPAELWPERLDSVLAVVYLVFNEGYSASSGSHATRADLCAEAIRLGTILWELAPGEPEVGGLLALMLLHDSRRTARADGAGDLVALSDQDRRLWDREKIMAAEALLRRVLSMGRPGPYQLQAAISAVHATASSHETTDWPQIVALYDRLHALAPSPIVRLNQTVARSYAEGPEAALRALSLLADSEGLANYQPYWAAQADLLRRAGRRDAAVAAYGRAIELSGNDAERRFLERRLAVLASSA